MLHSLIALAALVVAGQADTPRTDDPLTRPIAVERAREWLAPRAPSRVFANSYLVGFAGLSVALIDTGDGLILIDGGLPQAAGLIEANVERLGFNPRDIRYIFSTEPHFDHAGGLAALARDTGATVIASERGAEGLRSGRLAADDPQRGYDHRSPPVAQVRVMNDHETLSLGDTVVTAYATPGHTMGSMSWGWSACEDQTCRAIVFASSLNPASADGYRYTASASKPILDGFAHSYETFGTMPCDILITAHPDQGGVTTPYRTGPEACSDYAASSKRALAARIAGENADPDL